MQRLSYPVDSAARSSRLRLDRLHTLPFEESGNPLGKAVVYLHGGPGAGLEASARQVHDPQACRWLMFDQRGCGRSTPAGERRENTAAYRVADTEQLREHLGIERWIISRSSWGSALALACAQAPRSRPAGVSAWAVIP